ncbi:hypothetical protein [Photobacterium sanguinicancri]|uniref:Uncharacterized protein n=1 Tax=Photobacterium sanguinicancri TaxID=875932 RepID=A0ABX4FUQ1_9GAMM|nr:hypothetical protein [Photobacterium sanguinicancri]OZS42481.1 hypothetical protein ASV53_18150 [Photobacterium sanguinicancri]
MGFSDLEKLKQLSWYTTVPLLVFAWVLQDKVYLDPEFLTVLGGVSIVGSYFIKVIGILGISYIVWLGLVSRMGDMDNLFTMLLATFILSVAGVGFGISLMKPSDITLNFNMFWFLGFGSIAFNLYQMLTAKVESTEQDRKTASVEPNSSR